MIGNLTDEQHERLWRICDELVFSSGARSALVCDESNGAVLVSVGDASAGGSVSNVQRLSAQEFAVEGDAGQIYAVDVPGGAILVVLHDAGALDDVRAAAAEAIPDVAELLASLPVPPPEPAHVHAHDRAKPPGQRQKRPRAAKKASAPKKAAKAAARKAANRTKRAPASKPKARARPKPKRR